MYPDASVSVVQEVGPADRPSAFIHTCKPAADAFGLALDPAQTTGGEMACIDDRQMFVEIATASGIRGVHHPAYASTSFKLAMLGRMCPDGDKAQS